MTIVARAPNGLVVSELNYKPGIGGVGWCDPHHAYEDGRAPKRWESVESATAELAACAPMVARWIEEGSVVLVEEGASHDR